MGFLLQLVFLRRFFVLFHAMGNKKASECPKIEQQTCENGKNCYWRLFGFFFFLFIGVVGLPAELPEEYDYVPFAIKPCGRIGACFR